MNSIVLSNLDSGIWYWSVSARNDRFETFATETRAFLVCRPYPPSLPIQLYPLNGDYVPDVSFSLKFYAPGTFGVTCDPQIPSGYYKVEYWHGSTKLNATSNSTGETHIAVYDLQQTQWIWKVFAINEDLRETSTAEIVFYVCRHPSATALVYPDNLAVDIYNLGVVLQWSAFTPAMIGTPCSALFSAPGVYVLLDREQDMDKMDFRPTTVIMNATTTQSETDPSDLEANTTYYWRVSVTNGREWNYSAIWSFTTRAQDCTTVNCSIHGNCDEQTLQCVCNFGWTGLDCSIPPPKDKLNLPLIIGVAGGGLLLAACLLATVIAVVVRRRRRRLVHLERPDFTPYMFLPVSLLPLTPAEQDRIDHLRIDVERLLEGPFDPLFNMIVSMDVCDADNVVKALVYSYCRRGRGLEFLLYLIEKETECCTESSQLFRADCMATKAFKYYVRLIGLPYLFDSLSPVIAEMLQQTIDQKEAAEELDSHNVKLDALNADFEVDPELMKDASDGTLNLLLLMLTCQKLITQITRSSDNCPWQIRKTLVQIKKSVGKKFPGFEQAAMGSFLFLRYFLPSVAVPSSFGILTTLPSAKFNRELLLVCKVIQALSNRVLSSSKEDFMVKLSGFVQDNLPVVDSFYEQIETGFYQSSGDFTAVPQEIYDNSLQAVTYAWERHLKKNSKAARRAAAKAAMTVPSVISSDAPVQTEEWGTAEHKNTATAEQPVYKQ